MDVLRDELAKPGVRSWLGKARVHVSKLDVVCGWQAGRSTLRSRGPVWQEGCCSTRQPTIHLHLFGAKAPGLREASVFSCLVLNNLD